MADSTSIAEPLQPKKRKVNKKLTDAEILELLEKSDLSDYDSVDDSDEDYGWDSTSESEGDSDVAVVTTETSAPEDGHANFSGSECVNDQAMSHFEKIPKDRQKQVSHDELVIKLPKSQSTTGISSVKRQKRERIPVQVPDVLLEGDSPSMQ